MVPSTTPSARTVPCGVLSSTPEPRCSPRTGLPSWMRTPRRCAVAASPQVSRAGSTRPPASGSRKPARYVGEFRSDRTPPAPRKRAAIPCPRYSAASSLSSPTSCGSVATLVLPHNRKSASMPSASTNFSIARRFSRPNRTNWSISRGHDNAPWARPCVRDSDTKPPLRPLPPYPNRFASSSSTSWSGRCCLARSAAHSPVKPPPTTTRSARSAPDSGSRGGGRSARSNQYTETSASASDTSTWLIRRYSHHGR